MATNIPAGVKLERLDFINSKDIPEQDKELLRKFAELADIGPVFTSNQQRLYPVEIVEKFYSQFLPFMSQLQQGTIE